MAFSPDNRWLAAGSADGITWLWDLTSNDLNTIPLIVGGWSSGPISSLAFSPDEKWLATGSQSESNVWLWDLTAIKYVQRLARFWELLSGNPAMDFLRSNHPVLSWLWDAGETFVWEFDIIPYESRPKPQVLNVRRTIGVTCVRFSANSRWLGVGSDRGNTAQLWDLKSSNPNQEPTVLEGHEDDVTSVAFSANNRWLVTGSDDRTARLWDLTHIDVPQQPLVLKGHDGNVTSVAFSANN